MDLERAQQGGGASVEKTRHGCLTAYLVVMMASAIMGSLIYMFISDQALMLNDPELPSSIRRPAMVLLNILMGICALALWRWKKWGF